MCTNSGEDQALIKTNEGFMSVAHNSFTDAYNHFKTAGELAGLNPVIVNNMAVCLLYLGRLKDAIRLLEDNIKAQPDVFLHEGLLYNICSLYELDSLSSLQAKQDMLKLVAKHKGDGFNVTCFKF